MGAARLESALALLLIHAGHTVATDALCEAMWGDDGVVRSAATLDSHVFRLRRLLEPRRARGEAPTVLLREPAGVRLVVPPDDVDSARYTALAARAGELLARGDPAPALACAEDAAARWRGRPYGAVADEPWARAAVARLEEIHGQLRETHIGALLATGAVDRVLADVETALGEEPLRERLWVHRMAAHRAAGRRADALATYTEARTVLVDELGIEPGPELRALHTDLLRDDVDDGAAPPDPGPSPGGHRLPTPRSRLVGRGRELAQVLEMMGRGSLVTVVGAAGCGKTRLAVEAAGRAAPDHACFVDLTSASPDRVVDTVASTLGLPVAGSGEPVDALRRYTESRRLLLVLDNCEHVLDTAADLVDALLTGGTTLRVLATSREPLEVEGEQILVLAPLPAADAVDLFLERLPTPPPDDEADSVAEIAEAVDGLPLALELAAGRARAYTLTEIAAQVRADASALGRVGRARGTSHQGTVRDAIDSSYRALPDPLATVHRAVGAVPGPFTAQLAAGVVGRDVTDAVAGLAHRSLLTPLGADRSGGASRFAQLATVRGHAVHQAELAGEDPAGARDVWVERLVRARPALGSTRSGSWYRALDDDLAAVRATLAQNLVAAPSSLGVALAARLGLYWAFRGMGLEGERWLRTAVGACDADPGLGRPGDRAVLRVDTGGLWVVQGRLDAGRAQVRAGIAEGAGAGGEDAVLLCRALAIAAGTLARAGDAEVLTEMAAATREVAAGSSALDVVVRHVELTRATVVEPGPELVDRYADLHRDARAEDNLYSAWLAAANGARLLLQGGRAADALPWARSALHASAQAGLRDNAFVLEVYGAALGTTGEHTAALRVFGAVEAQHRGAGVPWPRDAAVAELVTTLTARVGPGEAERARTEGAQATLEELART